MVDFATRAKKPGREPIQLVDLTLEECGLEFGKAPCTGEGEHCYKTFTTCKDRANFDATPCISKEAAVAITSGAHAVAGTLAKLTVVLACNIADGNGNDVYLLKGEKAGVAEVLLRRQSDNTLAFHIRDLAAATILQFVSTATLADDVDAVIAASYDIATNAIKVSLNGAALAGAITDTLSNAFAPDLSGDFDTWTIFDGPGVGADFNWIALCWADQEYRDVHSQAIGSGYLRGGNLVLPSRRDWGFGDGAFIWQQGDLTTFYQNRGGGSDFAPSAGSTSSVFENSIIAGTERTRRFSTALEGLGSANGVIPCLRDDAVRLSPTTISQEKGLGQRAQAQVELIDFTHHDRGEDPYVDLRGHLIEQPRDLTHDYWEALNGAAAVSFGAGPSNGELATRCTIPASADEDFKGFRHQAEGLPSGPGLYDYALWLQAFAPGDVGKVIDVWQFHAVAAGPSEEVLNVRQCVLTAAPKRYTFRSTKPLFRSITELLTFGKLQVSTGGTTDRTAVEFYVWGLQVIERDRPGTYFGRLLARQRLSVAGRPLITYEGYREDDGSVDLTGMVRGEFQIEETTLPGLRGEIQIKAKDPLKIADDQRAKAPRASKGKLSTTITDSDLAATLTPPGIGDEEYPAAGFVRIDAEVLGFIRVGDALTLTRGEHNTVAASHDANNLVQLCLVYDAQRVPDMVFDLLAGYGAVPLRYMDKTLWDAEGNGYPFQLSGIITEPTGVLELVRELTEQTPFFIYWNERTTKIELKLAQVPDAGALTLSDETEFVEDTTEPSISDKDRISRVLIHFSVFNPTGDLKQQRNFHQLSISSAGEEESQPAYGRSQIKTIFARFLGPTDLPAAEATAASLLARYKTSPRVFEFELDAKDAVDLWTGNIFFAKAGVFQRSDGRRETITFQVLSASVDRMGSKYKYKAMEYAAAPFDPTIRIVVSQNVQNIDLREEVENKYGELAPDSAPEIFVEIFPNVIVGSNSVALPAFLVGPEWPVGTIIHMDNQGRIEGAGGEGGDGGGSTNGFTGKKGEDGGTALKVQYALDLTSTGAIWAGAGGGGGGAGAKSGFTNNPGGGGGGGTGANSPTLDLGGAGGERGKKPGMGNTAKNGMSGTRTTGGNGGVGQSEEGPDAASGGDGGGPGLDGQNGGSSGSHFGGAKGLKGRAIDGNSLINGGAGFGGGDVRGTVVA